MLVLTAAVTVVGALCLLDLTLTFGVIRRLREHTTTLQSLADNHVAGGIPLVGSSVAEFFAATVDGEPLSHETLGDTVVVFVAPDCPSCRQQLPQTVERARKYDRSRTLVVIDGQLAEPTEMVAAFSPVARVVVETTSKLPVMAAFGVSAYPAACTVSDGVVLANSANYALLPRLAKV